MISQYFISQIFDKTMLLLRMVKIHFELQNKQIAKTYDNCILWATTTPSHIISVLQTYNMSLSKIYLIEAIMSLLFS